MTKTLIELADYIRQAQPSVETQIKLEELMVLAPSDDVVTLLTFLRDDAECQFTQLVDVCGADYPERAKRFDVVYNLLSVKKNQRVRVKIQTNESTPVPSVVPVFSTAGWFERETWDMYGIYFSGNPDLRRILTDYGFDGHPLRKDFPLTGFVELRYDEEQKAVVYSPVKLTQAYRTFDFMSPWEGAKYALPATAPEIAQPENAPNNKVGTN
jgi:NADH-quinone oxidoreductase subunit C